jgi:hypothetical protein
MAYPFRLSLAKSAGITMLNKEYSKTQEPIDFI